MSDREKFWQLSNKLLIRVSFFDVQATSKSFIYRITGDNVISYKEIEPIRFTIMYKLCLNSRDELMIIDLEEVAYFQANGNYAHLQYIKGETHLLTVGLSKVEEYIRRSWPKDIASPFVRLGRSLIINQRFLSHISVLRQKLTLSDRGSISYALTISKPVLKAYKESINNGYIK